ncbi:MAG TPA: potassium-transporting ATPase subunit KdpA [Planctomycetota bacterium]|nr:potassium-transporting ATPase subunit KdpA [Planctomycetota bacterium]
MNGIDGLQIGIYLAAVLLPVVPLGAYMARVYERRACGLDRWLGPVERAIYRVSRVNPDEEMGWRGYAGAMLAFNVLGALAVYAIQRVQHLLPLNPQGLGGVSPDSSFDTAISFATNTNWQGYAGEATLSYATQMGALGVQNFVSAATGMAILAALARGFSRKLDASIGNFWVDLVRGTLYVLLPLSLVLAVVLVSQGVVHSFEPNRVVETLEGAKQVVPLGPGASQIAIKQLGTNGGGFFNANSAHPLENPTPLANFLECVAILLVPAALCETFGRMIGDRRQGWALLAAMLVVFVPALVACALAEQHVSPAISALGVEGGNLEGKEVRIGVVGSALWATATTAASNGSVNAMHDSFTPLGGLVPMWLMQLGEVVFGGVGSGLYGMLLFAIVAVFVAGLMVGRTPEYLGKKIEPFEMKMAAVGILVSACVALIGTAIAVVAPAGRAALQARGPHGFSEALYAFSSAANNNGSAFAGLSANVPFWNVSLGIAMWLGRFWIAVPVLAIAGALAAKKSVPPSAGTLPTHGPLFVVFLVSTVLVVGALTFLPALALGPIVEHLAMEAPR